MAREEVILIRGDHEDLTLQFLYAWGRDSYLQRHHHANGTVDTVCQLTESTMDDLFHHAQEAGKKLLQNPYIQEIIPSMMNYYETEHCVFTHGWIPCTPIKIDAHTTEYVPMEDWRHASEDAWNRARWINGMEAAHGGVTEESKAIVCGHWHCSYGHSHDEGRGGEFANSPDFSPYYGPGIIALDACTVVSKRINCMISDN